jgi:hypothetical protein
MSKNITNANTQKEIIDILKNTFSTLDAQNKAKFTNWCHEEVEKTLGEVVAQKKQEVNDKFNKFIAKANDLINKNNNNKPSLFD